MSDAGVTYTAPCPVCGVDAQWTGWVTRQLTDHGEIGPEAMKVSIACPCDRAQRPTEVTEVAPSARWVETTRGLPLCAHGRLYAGCTPCGTPPHGADHEAA